MTESANALRPAQLVDLLGRMLGDDLPVLLVGPPGVGKTAIVRQVAERMGAVLLVDHASLADPTDAKGLAFRNAEGTEAVFLPFDHLARAKREGAAGRAGRRRRGPTSGSMWTPETLTTLGSELSAILSETRPERVHVLHADAVVQQVETYEPGDELRLELRGGGGTDFRPVFEWVERQPDPPACLIYLTDGEGTFPAAPPAYPVLWAMVSDGSRRPPAPPFGLEVPIDAVWPVRAAASPQGDPA